MDERKLFGLFAIIIGASIIAPRETNLIIDAISKIPKKKEENKKDNFFGNYNSSYKNYNQKNMVIPIQPIQIVTEKNIGLIRKAKRNMKNKLIKFWRWVY